MDLSVPIRWTPDGRGIAYVESHERISNIWIQPLQGGTATPLTSFKSDQIFAFDWSRDSKQLALWRAAIPRDVVLVSSVR